MWDGQHGASTTTTSLNCKSFLCLVLHIFPLQQASLNFPTASPPSHCFTSLLPPPSHHLPPSHHHPPITSLPPTIPLPSPPSLPPPPSHYLPPSHCHPPTTSPPSHHLTALPPLVTHPYVCMYICSVFRLCHFSLFHSTVFSFHFCLSFYSTSRQY